MAVNSNKIKRLAIPAAAAAIFLASLGWLLYCLVPTVYWGDSAELTASAYVLGVSHAPGYPLYVELSRLFQWIPAGSPAFRGNLSAAVYLALALAAVFLAVRRATDGFAGGIAAAAALALVPSFLRSGLYAEVYSLHMLLYGIFLFIVLKPVEEDRRMWLVPWLLLGLGLSHHALLLFPMAAYFIVLALGSPGARRFVGLAGAGAALGGIALIFHDHPETAQKALITAAVAGAFALCAVLYAAFLVWKGGGRGLGGHIAAVLLASLLGLAAWLHVPLSAARYPLVNWWGADNLKNFLSLVTLRGYLSSFPQTKAEWLMRLRLDQYVAEMPIYLLALGLLGLIVACRRQWRGSLLLTLTAAATFVGVLLVEHGKPESLRLPVFVSLAAGLGFLAGWVAEWRILRRGRIGVALAIVIAAVAVWGIARNAPRANLAYMNRSAGAHELGEALLSPLPDGAILFVGLQTPGIMDYFQACEPEVMRGRKIAVVPVSFLTFEWRVTQLAKEYPRLRLPLVETPVLSDNVYRLGTEFHSQYAKKLVELNDLQLKAFSDFLLFPMDSGIYQAPRGALYQLVGAGFTSGQVLDLLATDAPPRWNLDSAKDPVAATNLASVLNERGGVYLNYAFGFGNRSYVDRAEQDFKLADRVSPNNPEALSGLGQCAVFRNKFDEAILLQRRAVMLDMQNAALHDALATTYFRKHTRESMQLALAEWGIALSMEPKNPKFYHNMASAMVGMGDAQAAVQAYLKAIEIAPDYVAAYINLSRIYRAQRNCPEMLSNLERARDRVPDSMSVLTELAAGYSECGMKRLFQRVIEDMSTRFPRDVGYYRSMAMLMRNAGKADEAVEAYKQAKSLSPLTDAADVFSGMDNCALASTVLKRVVQLLPGESDLRLLLASAQYDCGDKDAVRATLLKAKKDFPGNQNINKLITDLNAEN